MTGYRLPPELSPVANRAPAGLEEPAPEPRDLSQEAANMLELLSRQSASLDLLSITSKAAQAVIRQF
jgi:hypothetical protein